MVVEGNEDMIGTVNRHNWLLSPAGARRVRALFVVAFVLTAGCNDGRPTRVPVSGTVTIDGAPLAGAFVVFYPPAGRSSNGRTDSAGRFTLRCFEEADGALLGTHQVTVIAAQELSSHAMKWSAPKKYADHKTSGLKYAVDGPTDSVKFDLTWDGGKPFIEKANNGD